MSGRRPGRLGAGGRRGLLAPLLVLLVATAAMLLRGADRGARPGSRRPDGRAPAEPVAVRSVATPTIWQGAAIWALALGLAYVAVQLLWVLARPLALVVAAIVISQAVGPIADRLGRRLPRIAAVLLVYLVVFALVGGAGWYVVQQLSAEAGELIGQAPRLVDQFGGLVDFLSPELQQRALAAARSGLSDIASQLVLLPLSILHSLLDLALVVVLSLYWTLAAPDMRRFGLSLIPRRRHRAVNAVLDGVGAAMGGSIRGSVLDGLAVGAATYLGLLALGMDFRLSLALIAFFGELIPLLGPFIAGVPAVALALLISPTRALLVAGLYVAIQQFENHLLVPNIMRAEASIPPVLVIIALLLGSALGGILGALLAVPVAGALRVLTLRVVAPALRRKQGIPAAGEPTAGG